ncbi:TetR/AcrR family transcriptional regulator [Gryllotalpicola protaetiae]|uniref:TetR/AcrR family transcriptional regulator n=1 Tax=Gryllotalpicola protaetiae TaxID=2419771 RepID=A0A387BKX4_9MICO|nr:TetR/AcrR family transcriptional regulator [Gryllotalpicola protaetiae]AYG04523.1 TetR/AcrR family transcriptional regulator [Gryllotalpicola protaetiae]
MIPTAIAPRPPAPAKLKILDVADQLFYNEGIHTVGVDRIITEAHVTKATFYKHYRSKDLLIVAYVEGRHLRAKQLIDEARSDLRDAADVLRALATLIGQIATRPGFHGCPFINAAAQFGDPSHPVRQAVSRHRGWERSLVAELVDELGHAAPEDAVDDLILFRDGALSGSNVGDPERAYRALARAIERIIAERSAGAAEQLLTA